MLAVAITSIPPRFGALSDRLTAILAQRPDALLLTIPDRYGRFPEWDGTLPKLPRGVTLLRGPDYGPATKLIAAAHAFPKAPLLICDDDCDYGPGWLTAFRDAAKDHPEAVIAASPFDGARVGARPGTAIVQGFAGVLLPTHRLLPLPPDPLLYVDDIWLSASIAAAKTPVLPCPEARRNVTPCSSAQPLQTATIQGQTRADLNRQAVTYFRDSYNIW